MATKSTVKVPCSGCESGEVILPAKDAKKGLCLKCGGGGESLVNTSSGGVRQTPHYVDVKDGPMLPDGSNEVFMKNSVRTTVH